jgi:endonuclease/exonuclease/phosphatase family metal-dependent hydrolase
MDRRLDLDRIAKVLRETGADVIGLQEVVRELGASTGDQAAYLAKALDMDLVMGETRRHGLGTYGNAVLTHLPVVGAARCDLSVGTREARGCLRVDLAVDGSALHLFNCHFGLSLRERSQQLRLLADFILLGRRDRNGTDPGHLPGPRVLMGDFNEWHPGPIGRRLRREFVSPLLRRARRTHPAVLPLFPLDRIYWDEELIGNEFRVHRSRLARRASDHLPVIARLSLAHRAPADLAPGSMEIAPQ